MKMCSGLDPRNALLLIDGSYCAYNIMQSAIRTWRNLYYDTGREDIVLPEPGSVPYEDLPDLVLETRHFKRVLHEAATEKMNVISSIMNDATGMFFGGGVTYVDVVIARESRSPESFRRAIFPEYKIQRHARRAKENDFNHWKILDHVFAIMPGLLSCGRVVTMSVPGAEGDDIIAIIAKSDLARDKYSQIVLLSSDRDFCQLHKPEYRLRQFTLEHNEVLCECKRTQQGRQVKLRTSAEQALHMKILTGDKSDNIPAVQEKMGPVSAYKIVCEGSMEENLNSLFQKNVAAKVAYDMNRKLIDFDMIPKDVQDRIMEMFVNLTQNGTNLTPETPVS